MRKLSARWLVICGAFALIGRANFAYEVPLSDHSVREAYFLGQRRDEKMGDFFAAYDRRLPLPERGPHISQISLYTPYAQVVEQSRIHSVGYSAQQAAEEYRRRGDTIRLHVRLLLTPTYTVVEALDSARRSRGPKDPEFDASQFWRGFEYHLRQDGHDIPGTFVQDEPIYAVEGKLSGGLVGANVWFDYSAEDVKSEEAEVEVVTPGGQRVVAEFDLEKLR